MPIMRPVAGVALVCAALLAGGCAARSAEPPVAGAPSSAPLTSASTAGGSPSPDVRTVTITVNGKQVSPPPAVVQVRQGQTLRLVVTSDHDDELHAHGFDEEARLKAGTPTTLRLTATQPGVYEVETHDPALTLLTVAVR
jgi:plastocyanin